MAHHFTPIEDFKRQCMCCGITVPDPLAGMAKTRSPDAVEADWVRVPDVAPETWVVDCGDQGLLFIRRKRPGWMPIWLVKGGRKPRPLSSGPLERAYVRAYADDLVKRSAKVAAKNAAWKGGRPTADQWSRARSLGVNIRGGANAGEAGRDIVTVHARKRALKTGICEEL